MPRYLALVCAALFAAPAVHAQAADSVRHLPAASLREAVAAAPGEQAHALYARMVVDAGAYTVIALRRTADGEAEVHAEWDDVMMIQEGAATLLSGGRVSGGRQTAPGEMRGGRIAGRNAPRARRRGRGNRARRCATPDARRTGAGHHLPGRKGAAGRRAALLTNALYLCAACGCTLVNI